MTHNSRTLTFDLGGHVACQWYGSLFSISIPSLKFVRFSSRKIWYTSGLSISRPGDLDLWLLTLKLVRIIARGVGNILTNFGVSRTFRSRLISQHLSDASRDLCDLDLWPWRSWRLLVIRVFVLHLCTNFEKFIGLFGKYSVLNISRPGDLDLWLLTLKLQRFIVHCPDLHNYGFVIYFIAVTFTFASMCVYSLGLWFCCLFNDAFNFTPLRYTSTGMA